MEVPDRARPTIFSDVEARRVEPFCYISSFINPQKEKWHASLCLSLQSRQPLADLFE
tara:strand:- start:88 stop:258 length:171 start_codon:yes stop_codon:yes gene_type:complete